MRFLDGIAEYDSIFAQASFQFCGHIDEYLIRHTRHLGLLYTQTRFGKDWLEYGTPFCIQIVYCWGKVEFVCQENLG